MALNLCAFIAKSERDQPNRKIGREGGNKFNLHLNITVMRHLTTRRFDYIFNRCFPQCNLIADSCVRWCILRDSRVLHCISGGAVVPKFSRLAWDMMCKVPMRFFHPFVSFHILIKLCNTHYTCKWSYQQLVKPTVDLFYIDDARFGSC